MLISLALFVITAFGMLVGSIAPWQEAARVGPFLIAPYAVGLVLQQQGRLSDALADGDVRYVGEPIKLQRS